jgi:hypothetical protein
MRNIEAKWRDSRNMAGENMAAQVLRQVEELHPKHSARAAATRIAGTSAWIRGIVQGQISRLNSAILGAVQPTTTLIGCAWSEAE